MTQKTWNTWKTFWMQEFISHHEMRHMTANQHPILSAHATTTNTISSNDIIDVLDDLANAATYKNSLIYTQASTIKSQQLTIEELTATNAKLYTIIESSLQKISNTKTNKLKCFQMQWICWTHGYYLKKNHTIKTCNNQKDDNKNKVTRTNTMGGSQDNKGWDS